MLLFSVFEQCKAKGGDAMTDTMKGAWKLLVWSFEVLFSGYHPKTDHNATPGHDTAPSTNLEKPTLL